MTFRNVGWRLIVGLTLCVTMLWGNPAYGRVALPLVAAVPPSPVQSLLQAMPRVQLPVSGAAERVGHVIGGPQMRPSMDDPVAADAAVVKDGRIPAWQTRYGTQAGRKFMPPLAPPSDLSPMGPQVDIGGWRTFDLGGNETISGIAYGSNGSLYVGVQGKGVWVYGPDSAGHYTWSAIVPSAGGLASTTINALAVSGDRLWIGTDAGISELNLSDGAWNQFTTSNSTLPGNSIRAITAVPATGGSREFYVATTNGAWRLYASPFGGGATPYLVGLNVNDVTYQNAANTRYEWFALDASVRQHDLFANTWTQFHQPAGCSTMEGGSVLAVDGQGGVWIGAVKFTPALPSGSGPQPNQPAALAPDGICRYWGGFFKHYDNADPGLPSDWVSDMSTDSAGRVWMSFQDYNNRYGGAAVMEPPCKADSLCRWAIYDKTPHNDPLAADKITTVAAVGESVWFGYQDLRSVTQYSPNWTRYSPADLGGVGAATTVYLDPLEAWVGQGGGIARRNGAGWQSYAIPGNVSTISKIARSDRLWIGTHGSGLFSWDEVAFGHQTTADGLPSDDIRDLAVDSEFRLWVATSSGLALRAGDYWLNFSSANSALGSDDLLALAVDSAGKVWIGTNGSGVYVLDPNSEIGPGGVPGDTAWTHLTSADGLPGDTITGLMVAPDGQVWAIGPAGQARMDSATGVWTPTGHENSVSIASDPSGRVWLGTTTGLWLYSGGVWTLYQLPGSLLEGNRVLSVAADGTRTWVVTGAGVQVRGDLTGPLGFFPPTISSFSPTAGGADTIVTINGDDFDANPSVNTVSFGNLSDPTTYGEIDVASPTQLKVHVPLLAVSGKLTVRAHRLTGTSSADFTVLPAIRSVSPACAGLGGQLTIVGSGFNSGGGGVSAMVKLGNGPWRFADAQDPTSLRQLIRPDDTDGPVSVRLGQTGQVVTSAQSVTIDRPVISQVAIQQAVQGLPLVWAKRTLIQLGMRSQRGACATHVDNGQLEFKLKNGSTRPDWFSFQPTAGGLTIGPAAPQPLAVANAINFVTWSGSDARPDFGLGDFDGVRLHLFNGPVEVVTFDIPALSFNYLEPHQSNFLNVQVYPTSDPTDARYQVYLGNAQRSLDHVARVYPFSDLETYYGAHRWLTWAWQTLGWKGPINLDNDDQFAELQSDVEDIRTWTNDHGGHFSQAVGIIDTGLFPAGTDTLGRSTVECNYKIDCDQASAAVFNTGDAMGKTYLHETYHSTGGVPVGAPNHDPTNRHHSWYNTMTNGNCVPGLTYRQALIDQLGFAGQVVRLERATRPFQFPLTGCDETTMPRSLMSYSLLRTNVNSFFEPVDYIRTLLLNLPPFARGNQAPARLDRVLSLVPAAPSEQEYRLSGAIASDGQVNIGLSYLDSAGGQLTPASPGAPFSLLLRGANGAVLSELPFDLGINVTDGTANLAGGSNAPARAADQLPPHLYLHRYQRNTPISAGGTFNLRVPFSAGAARVEILHDGTLLWGQNVSANAPVLSVNEPSGGTYAGSGPVNVTWTATDPDGDPLSCVLEYSPDDGATWEAVATDLTGNSYQWVPGYVPDSTQARLRLTASDGFHTTQAVSDPFTLQPRAPVALIMQPSDGQQVLEGDGLSLVGDSMTSGGPSQGSFEWFFDGNPAGTGQTAGGAISQVGSHMVTLRVTYQGLVHKTSVTINVLADYDHDGIPNSYEQAHGLNPLDRSDSAADPDGDGLSSLQEYQLGSDPQTADSDGDGVSDGAELAGGTDPNDPAQVPPQVPTLVVGASQLGFRADPGQPTQGPWTVGISNAGPGNLSWTAQSSAAWLSVTEAGNTPGTLTASVDPTGMAPGTYSAQITVSAAGANGSPHILPVVLQVFGAGDVAPHILYLPVVARQ